MTSRAQAARRRASYPASIDYVRAYDMMMDATAAQDEPDAEDRDRLLRWEKDGYMEPAWNESWNQTEWVLRRVPTSSLVINYEFAIDPDKVAAYAEVPSDRFPPLLIGDGGRPLDGQHRLLAARQRGDKTILAYMPRQKR